VPTLILTPRFTDDSIALWRAANRKGWNVERMTRFRPPDDFRIADEPVLYVEALTAPLFAEALGVTLLEPPIDWLPRLPFEYRLRDLALMALGEARGVRDRRFIKPPNDKSFQAAVYAGHELPAEYPDDMPVLVSEVVTWGIEFRCFVLDRNVRTFSVYLRGGELQRDAGFPHSDQEEAELLGYTSRLLSDSRVDLPRACVIDVGIIRDQGWAVVEQNAAWGSGIYGCDPEQVLEVVRHATVASSSGGG
jgi:hypothetical protein